MIDQLQQARIEEDELKDNSIQIQKKLEKRNQNSNRKEREVNKHSRMVIEGRESIRNITRMTISKTTNFGQ